METGALGVLGLAAFLLVPPILLLRFAFGQAAERRHAALAFTVAVAIAGYIAAIFFYDAFGFFQTFFILCMLLAVGAWLLTEAPRRATTAPAESASADAAATEAAPAEATT
jgi:hypothetical protein